MTMTGKKEILEEKLVPAPLISPKIPYGLACDETRGLLGAKRRLTGRVMTCSTVFLPQPRLWLL